MIHSGSKRKTGVKIGDTNKSCVTVEPYNNVATTRTAIHDKRGKHRRQANSHCSHILLIRKAEQECIASTNENRISFQRATTQLKGFLSACVTQLCSRTAETWQTAHLIHICPSGTRLPVCMCAFNNADLTSVHRACADYRGLAMLWFQPC